MTKQQDRDDESQEQKDNAREAVKDILRVYLDWPLEEIIAVGWSCQRGTLAHKDWAARS